jgi:hypothetical protein
MAVLLPLAGSDGFVSVLTCFLTRMSPSGRLNSRSQSISSIAWCRCCHCYCAPSAVAVGGRGLSWERLRILLVHASLGSCRAIALSCLQIVIQAGRVEGQQQEKLVVVSGKGQIFYSAMCLVQNPHPATVVHALMVELQEAGCHWVWEWQWPTGCRGLNSQVGVVVGPALAGGDALSLHSGPSHVVNPSVRGAEWVGWGELVAGEESRRGVPYLTGIDTQLNQHWHTSDQHWHTTDDVRILISSYLSNRQDFGFWPYNWDFTEGVKTGR